MLAAGTAGLSAPTRQPGQSSFHLMLSAPQLFLDPKCDFKRTSFPFESRPQPLRGRGPGQPSFLPRNSTWLHLCAGCHTAQGEALKAAKKTSFGQLKARGGCLWRGPQPRGSALPTSPQLPPAPGAEQSPCPAACWAPLTQHCHL